MQLRIATATWPVIVTKLGADLITLEPSPIIKSVSVLSAQSQHGNVVGHCYRNLACGAVSLKNQFAYNKVTIRFRHTIAMSATWPVVVARLGADVITLESFQP